MKVKVDRLNNLRGVVAALVLAVGSSAYGSGRERESADPSATGGTAGSIWYRSRSSVIRARAPACTRQRRARFSSAIRRPVGSIGGILSSAG
jgi:hypothetical protein